MTLSRTVRVAARTLVWLTLTLPHLCTTTAWAAAPLDAVRSSADITVALGALTADDEDVVVDDLTGNPVLLDVGAIPAGTDLTAYHRLAGGDSLLSFDTTVMLPGGVTAAPGDVVRFDGLIFSILFDASAGGVPDGAVTDAVSALGPADLFLSFDTAVDFGSFVADRGDLVRVQGGTFALFFDASSAGIDASLDLDGAHVLPRDGHLLLSFDGSGNVDGTDFDDEDILELDPTADSWELAFDASAQHSGWAAADLDAVDVAIVGLTPFPPEIVSSQPGESPLHADAAVHGTGAPHATPGDRCIEIYAVGPNGTVDQPPASVDDELIGVGGTDEGGLFVDLDGTPGITLFRPIVAGERIFAFDVCEDSAGAAVAVAVPPAPAPATTPTTLMVILAVLLGVAAMRFRPNRRDSAPVR